PKGSDDQAIPKIDAEIVLGKDIYVVIKDGFKNPDWRNRQCVDT
ncbi:hypothetical protein LCGC14_2347570, partial [marine sediment metagenome]